MKFRWRRWLMGTVGVLGLTVAGGALVLSYDAPCESAPPVNGDAMQAIVYRCYGATQVLHHETVSRPQPAEDQVRVRVHAASLNPLDMHYMLGTPYILRLSAGIGRPTVSGFGNDFAGIVDAVGAKVTRFKPGDRVFGVADGALANHLVRRAEGSIVAIPDGVSFEQAAAMPIAGVTALQALRDKAGVKAGQRVLINGASGGVGSFAVQIAKAFGAEVSAVCSTRNAEWVRALGADEIIDYTKVDFTQGEARYDVVIDMVGNHSLSALSGVMSPDGVIVLVGSVEKNNWLAPFDREIEVALASLGATQRIEAMMASMNPADLQTLAELAGKGLLRAAVHDRYPLARTAEAMDLLMSGHTRGKIVVQVAE